jgi:hypothetical protein
VRALPDPEEVIFNGPAVVGSGEGRTLFSKRKATKFLVA